MTRQRSIALLLSASPSQYTQRQSTQSHRYDLKGRRRRRSELSLLLNKEIIVMTCKSSKKVTLCIFRSLFPFEVIFFEFFFFQMVPNPSSVSSILQRKVAKPLASLPGPARSSFAQPPKESSQKSQGGERK